jgi:hypothetical protein
MDYIFNELSLVKLSNRSDAINSFMAFTDVTSALHALGFKVLKVWNRGELLSYEFYDGFILPMWFKQKHYQNESERNKSRILSSLLTKHTNWSDDESAFLSSVPVICLEFKGNQYFPKGLKIAAHYKTISVSFNTHQIWDTHSLDLICVIEETNDKVYEQPLTINHASKSDHIGEHKDWLNYLHSAGLIGKEWNPSEVFFPNILFSNQLVDDGNWDLFKKKRDSTKSYHERLAVIIDYGTKVAERNLYRRDTKVSELNSTEEKKRIVFGAGTGKERTYLSIDLETGGFEVCNYLGKHIGEYFYDGTQTSGHLDDHNIKVKS